MKIMENIVAVERDGLDVRVISIPVVYDDKVINDITQAVRDACAEYIRTPEGRAMYDYNCSAFDWADFDAYVPNEICKKHGFTKRESVRSVEVDWDEQLAELDFEAEEEKE